MYVRHPLQDFRHVPDVVVREGVGDPAELSGGDPGGEAVLNGQYVHDARDAAAHRPYAHAEAARYGIVARAGHE